MNFLNKSIFFLLVIVNTTYAQVAPAPDTKIGNSRESGVIELTKAELKEFVQKLVELKQRRASQRAVRFYPAADSLNPVTDQEQADRLAQLEATLSELSDSLLELSTSSFKRIDSVAVRSYSDTSIITGSSDTLIRSSVVTTDLEALEKQLQMLQAEIRSIRKTDSVVVTSSQSPNDPLTKAYLNEQLAPIITKLEQLSEQEPASEDEESEQRSTTPSDELTEVKAEIRQLRNDLSDVSRQREDNSREDRVRRRDEVNNSDLKEIKRILTLMELQLLADAARDKKRDKEKRKTEMTADTLVTPDTTRNQLVQKDTAQIPDTVADTTDLDQQMADLFAALQQSSPDTMATNQRQEPGISKDDFNALYSELIRLREQIASLSNQMKEARSSVENKTSASSAASAKEEDDLADLRKIIRQQKTKQVFYGNNQIDIQTQYQPLLNEVVDTLHSHEALDILIIGYASQQGSASYNQQISAKRADSVKMYLMKKGIRPDRILSQYHGIDYQASQPKEARRVDLVYILR